MSWVDPHPSSQKGVDRLKRVWINSNLRVWIDSIKECGLTQDVIDGPHCSFSLFVCSFSWAHHFRRRWLFCVYVAKYGNLASLFVCFTKYLQIGMSLLHVANMLNASSVHLQFLGTRHIPKIAIKIMYSCLRTWKCRFLKLQNLWTFSRNLVTVCLSL